MSVHPRKSTKPGAKKAGAKPGTPIASRGLRPRQVNEAKREEAIRMLATGAYVGDVAHALDCHRDSVRQWRDSPDGQRLMIAARAERAKLFEGTAVAEARRALLELTPAAVAALAEDLRTTGKRGRAARDILDRVGVLRGSELFVKPSIDMSKLSDAALAELDAATEKGKV